MEDDIVVESETAKTAEDACSLSSARYLFLDNTFPPSELERLQQAHETSVRRRKRFAAEREAARKIADQGGGVIPRELLGAHLRSLWAFLFEASNEAPRTKDHPSLCGMEDVW